MLNSIKLGLFVVVVALFSLPKLAFGGAVQAAQSDKFVDSIGIAVHLNYYNNYWSTVEPLLTGLGIRHFRDGVFDTSIEQTTNYPEVMDLYYNHGMKATLCATWYNSNGVLDPTQIDGNLNYIANTSYSQYGGDSLASAVEAIEGANEWDVNYPGYNPKAPNFPAYVADLTTYTQALYTDVHTILPGALVVGPSMAIVQDQPDLPDYGSCVDTGNDHPYPGTGDIGYSGLDDYLTDSQTTWPGLPLVVTEDGYETNPNPDSDAVTQAYQANMEPHILLENFRRGVQRTFLYDFVDEGTSSDTTSSHHFGLVLDDTTTFPVKPAYNSIQNLISILSDPGTAFVPAATSFNLSGSGTDVDVPYPLDVHTLLLQKRSGNFYLVLWLESTNQSTNAPVTVTFDQPMATAAAVYNPCVSATATNVTLTSNAISLAVTTQPTIIEVTPNAPYGSLLVDNFLNLNQTSTNLNWETGTNPAADWLGRTSMAYMKSSTTNNYLAYSNTNSYIQGFTALIGFGFQTTTPDGVTGTNGYLQLGNIELFSSTNGTTWTSQPTYVGEVDKANTSDASGSARWLVPVSPSGALPAGTQYVKFVVNSAASSGLPEIMQMNVYSEPGVPVASPTSGSMPVNGLDWTYGSVNPYGWDMLDNGSWNGSASGVAMWNVNGTFESTTGGGTSNTTYAGDWWSYKGTSATRIYPTSVGTSALAIAPSGSVTIGTNTWSFGTANTYGYDIMENGVWSGASNGVAIFNDNGTPISISGGGTGATTYAGTWWKWAGGGTWTQIYPSFIGGPAVVPSATGPSGSLIIGTNTYTFGTTNTYGYEILENGSWLHSAAGIAIFNNNGVLVSLGGGTAGEEYTAAWWSYATAMTSTQIYPTSLGTSPLASAPSGSLVVGNNTWSFGASATGGYEILVNGVQAAGAAGVAIFNVHGTDTVVFVNNAGNWYSWNENWPWNTWGWNGWTPISTPSL